MEYYPIIFYLSLLLMVGCVAEIYVRMTGMGDKTEKIRGKVIPKEPKLFPPFALLIAAIIFALITRPS